MFCIEDFTLHDGISISHDQEQQLGIENEASAWLLSRVKQVGGKGPGR